MVPATHRYVDRLERVAATGPGYAGHAYTRYLGDLSGGQVVRTMLERNYGFQPEELTFYAFGVKAKPFKDHYRALLDDLGFTAEQADTAVEEAVCAFELNSALFDDLDQYVGATRPQTG